MTTKRPCSRSSAMGNYWRPAISKPADAVRKELEKAGEQLITLRVSPPAADYDGPVLFEAPAAGSLLAQMLGPSLSGARGPLAMQSAFDQLMDRLGGRSEWTGKLGTRVFPGTVSLVDDPTATQFQGRDLLGTYAVDQEGVKAKKRSSHQQRAAARFSDVAAPGPRSGSLQRPRPLGVSRRSAPDGQQFVLLFYRTEFLPTK